MPDEILYTDHRLLQLIAQDDQAALQLIYKRYWAQLYDMAYRRLKDTQQAEDIVQDIFINIWKLRQSLQVENLGAYLRTAVRHRVLNYVTRNKASESFYEPMALLLADSGSADELLLRKELMELLRLYIETLPTKRKQIFLLHLYTNLSTKEIAEKLSITQKTVQNQILNAIEGMKTQILPVLLTVIVTRL